MQLQDNDDERRFDRAVVGTKSTRVALSNTSGQELPPGLANMRDAEAGSNASLHQ